MFIQSIAVTALLILVMSNAGVVATATAIVIAAGCMGTIAPNNIANALDFFPKQGGTAAALLGAAQFCIAGLLSAVSTWLADGKMLPIALVLSVCLTGSWLCGVGATEAVAGWDTT